MLFTNPVHGNFAKDPAVVHFHGMYYLYYTVHPTPDRYGVGIAASPDMESWTIIGELPQDTPAERNGSAAPAAIVLNDRVHLFYQTYGNWRTDALCHAVSDDGVHFEKNPENPVYAPPATWCCGRAIDADVCILMASCSCTMQRATMRCVSRKSAVHGLRWIPALAAMPGRSWPPSLS